MTEIKKYNTGETNEDLKKKYNYDGSELRKAQMRMFEMLVFLDKICKKYKIEYFIAFGTLLGAVRHGGFIPWDDDLDVYINDKDLKRLRKIINNGNFSYVVQDYSIDKGFVRYYNVLRDLRSEYIKDEYTHNQRKYRGLQIDLFPYEYGVIELGGKFVERTASANEVFFLGKSKILSGLVFHMTRDIFIPFFKILSKLKGKKYVSLGYEEGEPGYRYLSSDVFPLKKIEFEGRMFPCPNHPKKVLRVDYGKNFMNLPPIETRNHHKVLNIRFIEDK